jgi:methionine-rich copper-binding protein CopC
VSNSVRHRVVFGTRRVGLGVIFGVVAVMTTAVPAAAHTALQATSPDDGARIGAAPDQIVLDFTGPVRPRVSKVTVLGPDGVRFELGSPQVASDKVTQLLRPLGGAGRYQIRYRAVAKDGHPLAGTVRFTLTRPGPGVTGPPANGAPGAGQAARATADGAGSGNDVPAWLLALGAAGTVSAVSGAMWFGRRATRDLD